jgi:hypothetical protein
MKVLRKIMYPLALTLFAACDSDEVIVDNTPDSYPITINFTHSFDGETLALAEQQYMNAAGNEMSVENLQYIISDIELHGSNGINYLIDAYHFVDINDAATLTFDTGINLTEGNYTGISFVYGLKGDKNLDGVHTDLNALSWSFPEMLGGGYHFMKLEGKFKDTSDENIGYATHMGTAREVRDEENTIFHENHIDINLSNNPFSVNKATIIALDMDIKKWYENPFVWDLNELGNMIMPNYSAQTTLRANGKDVWSVTFPELTLD